MAIEISFTFFQVSRQIRKKPDPSKVVKRKTIKEAVNMIKERRSARLRPVLLFATFKS